MNEKKWYFLLLFIFPVFFILHGINENYGLIPAKVLFVLLLKYSLVTVIISSVSWLLFKIPQKFLLFSFIVLAVYFFFGAAKDFFEDLIPALSIRYKYLIPIIVLGIILLYLLIKKLNLKGKRIGFYICTLLIVLVAFDAVLLLINILRHREKEIDMGDRDQQLIENLVPQASANKPTVFWIVFDEYPSSVSLKRGWGYDNPIDSMLRQRGFYVADSAKSNYNFTHYSLASTLDMVYLNRLRTHSIVTIRDLVRGNKSLAKNNVTGLFESQGYSIQNYSIYNLDKYPSKGILSFKRTPRSLIDHQTLDSRIKKDIGWNFINLFKKDKKSADSAYYLQINREIDSGYNLLLRNSQAAFREQALKQIPSFFMIHVLLPHEPFIYRQDGTFNAFSAGDSNKEAFLEQLKYTNRIIEKLTDSILSVYTGKELVIIIQGDHGFKFSETDPLFQQESCGILYAVYNSQRKYSSLYPSISSVNGFRILFNDYFNTRFPLLPDSSFNLYYR